MSEMCLPPISLDGVLDRPERFRSLAARHAPYFPVQRYLRNEAEHRSASGSGAPAIVAPNFRGDWAYDEPLVDGAEAFLYHEGFLEAARKLFDTPFVRPQQVYSNLTWQLPFHQGAGHTDVPAFRGIDRTGYPIWLLNMMGRSRLFEEARIPIATAVAWFYEGDDGGFEYWPEGPDRPPRVHQGRIHNTAIVGDNDRMFHRVMPVGRPEDGLVSGMSLETRLENAGDDQWRIVGDDVLAEFDWERLRVSVSWKAEVFRDAADQRRVDEHLEDLTLDDVRACFSTDLEAREIGFEPPSDLLDDPHFVDVLNAAYPHAPTVYAA